MLDKLSLAESISMYFPIFHQPLPTRSGLGGFRLCFSRQGTAIDPNRINGAAQRTQLCSALSSPPSVELVLGRINEYWWITVSHGNPVSFQFEPGFAWIWGLYRLYLRYNLRAEGLFMPSQHFLRHPSRAKMWFLWTGIYPTWMIIPLSIRPIMVCF